LISEEITKRKLTIKAIFKLLQWSAEHLPIGNSLIAYDVILLISMHTYAIDRITAKQLFASLPHSASEVRHHFQRFVDVGWIELYPNPEDKRIKKYSGYAKTYRDDQCVAPSNQ
jgi:DNA-binding MarR family transcriptional regulator